MTIKQFDVVQVALNPIRGSEQSGTRPCVVLLTNAMAGVGRMTVVAPLTSKKIDRIFPQEVLIDPSKDNGVSQPSKIKIDQVRAIASERVIRKMGTLEARYHQPILRALDLVFDREQLFVE